MFCMRRPFFVLSLAILANFSLPAQVNIKGRAIDSSSRTGIGFVSVSLLNVSDSSLVKAGLADAVGNFGLTAIQAGRYRLLLSSQEHQPYSRELVIGSQASNLDLGTITMMRAQKMLDEVVVRGEKRAIRYQDDRVVLNIAGNSTFKTSANVMDILGKAPGITVNGDGTLLMSGRNTPVIFIDGKPTTMSPEEQLTWLNGLSPELIESIELIHTPSSKYDGQYKGIIDVRLKKEGLGWKGSISSAFRQSHYPSLDNNLNLTLGTKKLTYGLRLGYVDGIDAHLYQALQQQANTNYMATWTKTRTNIKNSSLWLGVDYQINKDQSVGVSWKRYESIRDRRTMNTLSFSDSTRENKIGASQTNTLADPSQYNSTFNANYEAVVGKNHFSVFGTLTDIKNRQREDIQTSNSVTNQLLDYWKTASGNDVRIRTIQVDYTRAVPKGTLEAGIKFALSTTDNDLKYDTLTKDNTFSRDAGRTNRFQYDENVSAGYIAYNHKAQQFSFKLSLRTEHTHTTANAFTLNQVIKRDYLTWLPAVGFSYSISTNESINFSFTRRMTRPTFQALNPFRFYLSPLNYWVGNPYMQPSVTNLLTLSYNNKSFNVAVNVGKEVDFMTRYPEYNRVTNELQYLGRNLPYNNFGNIEAGYTLAITKWWKAIQNAGIYYNNELTPYLGVNYSIGVVDYSLSGSHVFTLPQGFTTDLTYRYKSKTGNGLYFIKANGALDIGLQKSWLQGKLNSKLNAYDLFNTNLARLVFREKSIINNQLAHRFWTQRVVFALTYNFGKAKPRARQARSTEEEGRAGN